jgi:hypothetical protein
VDDNLLIVEEDMGKGFFNSWNNETSERFNGSDVSQNCIYHLDRITGVGVLRPGSNQEYLEDKNSGGCYFGKSSYIVGYALPGVQPGDANFVLGFSSDNLDLNLKEKEWHKETKTWGNYTCFMWTLANGFAAQLDSFEKHAAQGKYVWHVSPPSQIDEKEAAQASAPVELAVPEDGSDYQGPPKSSTGT